MAFDAHIEDFQRLGLRQAAALDDDDPFGAVRSMADFGRRFAKNRDSLPQSDEDRAFHLVSLATDLVDYQLPFAEDSAAPGIIDNARKLLDEALELDPHCHDAKRMVAAADNPSFEDFYRFLVDGEEGARVDCERARAAVSMPDKDGQALGEDLAMRPYKRWLAAVAARALECGHYRKSVETALRLLELDPSDVAGARLTLALAYAKLEDEAGLDALVARHPNGRGQPNPWYALAKLALSFKRRDFDQAASELRSLIATYPHAGMTLARQDWLPDGVFSRIVVEPRSEDELILAVSEATVILQEGCDSHDRGALGSWIAARPEVVKANALDGAGMADAEQDAGTRGGSGGKGLGGGRTQGGRS